MSKFEKALAGYAVVTCIVAAAGWPVDVKADPVADFYAGKTLSIVSGFTPNGENDTYVRALGRHISKYIPGRPIVARIWRCAERF